MNVSSLTSVINSPRPTDAGMLYNKGETHALCNAFWIKVSIHFTSFDYYQHTWFQNEIKCVKPFKKCCLIYSNLTLLGWRRQKSRCLNNALVNILYQFIKCINIELSLAVATEWRCIKKISRILLWRRMTTMAFRITGISTGSQQKKHQSLASLSFCG